MVTTATLARHREQAVDLHWLPTGHQEGWEVDDRRGRNLGWEASMLGAL